MGAWDEYKKTMRAEPPIFDLARAGDVDGLEDLYRSGPPPDLEAKNARGYSALMLGAYNGRGDAVGWLLARGASPNSVDAAGSSVLMGAAFKGDVGVARLLVSAGADVSHRNARGQDALGFALAFGRTEMAAYLNSLSPRPKRLGWRTRLAAWATFLQPKRK